MLDWLRRILKSSKKETDQNVSPTGDVPGTVSVDESFVIEEIDTGELFAAEILRTSRDQKKSTKDSADIYIAKLRAKITSLAERFASGNLNRGQFESLYSHYQREIRKIERILEHHPETDQWKKAVSEGQSILIRRMNAARLAGYSIYDNRSGMPLWTEGEFGVDPDIVVPMLFAYRSAAEEIFGAGIRTSQIEGGKWLCYVPGRITTTVALLSAELS
ncbi:MAG: hypothetical protein MUO76_15170, partial [Anaerolineaceae bacterium]|nr:hypothetical protein [Anaerolineaceae bacterium]